MADEPGPPPAAGPSVRRRVITNGLLLLVTGVSLYLLFPSLLQVFSSWRSLGRLEPWWMAAGVLCEAASFVATWQLQRVALGTKRWFGVASSQLAGNAFGRIVPGGLAAAGGLQMQMLRRTGAATGPRAASALAAASALQLGTLFALPLLSVPAIVGGAPVDRSLLNALWLGAAALALLLVGIVAGFAFDRPLRIVARALQWLINRVRRKPAMTRLPDKLLAERDFIKRTLGDRLFVSIAAATGKSVFDYLLLVCCLRAVGVHPRPSLVLLAYVAAAILAMIPLTPGGLGFVEAGLVGLLALAGVSGGNAVVATLAYRLVSFWLPIPIGGVAYWWFRRRYDSSSVPPTGSTSTST